MAGFPLASTYVALRTIGAGMFERLQQRISGEGWDGDRRLIDGGDSVAAVGRIWHNPVQRQVVRSARGTYGRWRTAGSPFQSRFMRHLAGGAGSTLNAAPVVPGRAIRRPALPVAPGQPDYLPTSRSPPAAPCATGALRRWRAAPGWRPRAGSSRRIKGWKPSAGRCRRLPRRCRPALSWSGRRSSPGRRRPRISAIEQRAVQVAAGTSCAGACPATSKICCADPDGARRPSASPPASTAARSSRTVLLSSRANSVGDEADIERRVLDDQLNADELEEIVGDLAGSATCRQVFVGDAVDGKSPLRRPRDRVAGRRGSGDRSGSPSSSTWPISMIR